MALLHKTPECCSPLCTAPGWQIVVQPAQMLGQLYKWTNDNMQNCLPLG